MSHCQQQLGFGAKNQNAIPNDGCDVSGVPKTNVFSFQFLLGLFEWRTIKGLVLYPSVTVSTFCHLMIKKFNFIFEI